MNTVLRQLVSLGGVLNSGTGASTIKAISASIGGSVAGQSDRTVSASLAITMLGGGERLS